MENDEPREITLQWNDMCAVCECTLKKGERVWKQVDDMTVFLCLTCGNSKFKAKRN